MLERSVRRAYAASPVARHLLAIPAAIRRRLIGLREERAIRSAAILARRIAGDVVLDLPEFGGTFECSPRSHLFRRIMLHDRYEPEVAQLLRSHIDANRDFIDVGANIGFFSVLGARQIQTGRVLAIEPVPEAIRRFKANIARNDLQEQVILFEGALGSAPLQAEAYHIDGQEEYSSLAPVIHPNVDGREARKSLVSVETLDRLVARHGLSPGLVKLDIEGGELDALKGAKETLLRDRPVILCELDDTLLRQFGASRTDLLNFLRELDYEPRDAVDVGNPPESKDCGEILCLPR